MPISTFLQSGKIQVNLNSHLGPWLWLLLIHFPSAGIAFKFKFVYLLITKPSITI